MAPPIQKSAAPAFANAEIAAALFSCDMCGLNLNDFDPRLITRCAECFNLIVNWISAPSWTDLLEYNREFIRGERSATCYSMFPLFTDKTLHAALLRLHDYGIVVTDAQRGMSVIGQEKEGLWYEVKERAYLRCVIPTVHPHISGDRVGKLIHVLVQNTSLETVSYYEYSEYGKSEPFQGAQFARPLVPVVPRDVDVPVLPRLRFFFSSVGPSFAGRHIAKHRWAVSKEELAWQPWRKCRHNGLPIVRAEDMPLLSMGMRAFGRECKMTREMKPIVVTIAARDWPPVTQDLAVIVEKACAEVELGPSFGVG